MTIILSYLMSLLSDPKVLMGLGAVGSVLFIFFKGKSSGESVIQQEVQQAAQVIENQVIQTENQNVKVEGNKNETIQNIDDISDPAQLASLLTTLSGAKAPSDNPDKK